ncbi:hypothetical protein ABW20_dc0102430 [Dactylellina cionopaga]|nr:hypothetical protein ABW20_dc0102430 [Dactylellina cionopaga]
MNRLSTTAIVRAFGTSRQTHRPQSLLLKLEPAAISPQRALSTTGVLYKDPPPAGHKERPELPSDSDRTAQSPKSSDEKILDRAQQGEKDKAPFTEEEEKKKDLDRKEGVGKGEN